MPAATAIAYVRKNDGLLGSLFMVSCQARALHAYTSAYRPTIGKNIQPVRAASLASRRTPIWATR